MTTLTFSVCNSKNKQTNKQTNKQKNTLADKSKAEKSSWVKKKKKLAQRTQKHHHSVRKRIKSLLKATKALGLAKSLRQARHPLKLCSVRSLSSTARDKEKRVSNAILFPGNFDPLSLTPGGPVIPLVCDFRRRDNLSAWRKLFTNL